MYILSANMSTQRGNSAKKGPPKHQNRTAWKNVYHDTSKKSKQIATTEVAGVCQRCKDVIDWKIKYKKYKLLSQPKTCVTCKQKTVKNSYHVYCQQCANKASKCAKCGENTNIVTKPSLTAAEQASEDRQLQFELELLPERKRRTFRRLQEQGKLTEQALMRLQGADDDEDYDFDDDDDDDCSVQDDSDVDEGLDKLIEKADESRTKNDVHIKADELSPSDNITENEKCSIVKPDDDKSSHNNETVELKNALNASNAKETKASAQRGAMSQDGLGTETVLKDEVDMSKLELGDKTDI